MKEEKKVPKNVKTKILGLFIIMILILTFALMCYVGYRKYTGKESVNYKETSNIDYSVCFKQPNDQYEDVCQSENINTYVTKYIDYININFDYTLDWNTEVNSNYKYRITGEMVFYDKNNTANVLNRREYVFVPLKDLELENTNKIRVTELLKLNYDEYNDAIIEYRNNSNIQAGANLRVTLHVESANKQNKVSETILTSNNMAIEVPLGESTIQLKTDYNQINQSHNFEINTNETLVNEILKVLSILSGLIGLILIIIIICRDIQAHKSIPIYDKFIKELKNDFDADISELQNLIDTPKEEKYEYLTVNSFKDLYEEVNKSNNKQIYWNEEKQYDKNGKLKNRVSWFFIKNADKTVVRFIVDENKLTEKYKNNPNIIKDYRG